MLLQEAVAGAQHQVQLVPGEGHQVRAAVHLRGDLPHTTAYIMPAVASTLVLFAQHQYH